MKKPIKYIMCSIFDGDNKGYVDLDDIANGFKYIIIGVVGLIVYLYGMYQIIFNTNYILGDAVGFIDFVCLLVAAVITIGLVVIVGMLVCDKMSIGWDEIKYKKIIVCERKKDEGSDHRADD